MLHMTALLVWLSKLNKKNYYFLMLLYDFLIQITDWGVVQNEERATGEYF